jgi:integrase
MGAVRKAAHSVPASQARTFAARPCGGVRPCGPAMDTRQLREAAEQLLLTLAAEPREQHNLAEAIVRYRLEHLLVDGLAANTIAWREQTLARLAERFGKRDIASRWRDAAAELYRDLSPSCASMSCNTLGRILNLAKLWGWRADGHDLAGLCRIRSMARDRVLVLRERHALLGALEQSATPRTRVAAEAVRFVLHTGWRVGEAVSVEWQHVADDFGTVFLPSTKAGPQTRAIGQEASAVLEQQESRSCSRWAFPARRGDKPIDRRQAEEAMTVACKRAGIQGVSLHTLRHTRATVSAQMQLPTTSVALALGHTTEYQTSRYQHVDLDDVRMAATVVDMGMLSDRKVPRG